jgi:hypothetical protein
LIILINIAVILFLIFFVYKLLRRNGSYLQLGILFAITLGMNYPVRILFLYFLPDQSRPYYPGLTDLEALKDLSLLQIPGVFMFCVGYYLWERRGHAHLILQPMLVKVNPSGYLFLVMLYFISLAGKAYKVATGNYVSFLIGETIDLRWTNIAENIHMLGWVCFAGVWLLFFARKIRTPFRMAFFLMVNIIELSYQAIQGSKTFILLPVLMVIMIYYYEKRRIPLLGIMMATVFAMLIVFPFVSAYREYFYSNYRGIPSVSEFSAFETISETFKELKEGDENLVEKGLLALGRFGGADELYSIKHLVPSLLPYKYGKDMLAFIYSFIPRAIWPGKPIISPAAKYGMILDTITSVTPFPLGDMYWNFGIIGIILGMGFWGLFLGVCMSLFDYFFKRQESRFFVISIFFAEAYWLTTGEALLPMLLTSIPQKLFIYFMVYQAIKVLLGDRSMSKRKMPPIGTAMISRR